MRVVHRIALSANSDVQAELALLGIEVPDTGFAAFDIGEDDARWPAFSDWKALRRPSDIARPVFTKTEIERAGELELLGTWHNGYPQPDEQNDGYLAATYDLTDYCTTCGVGLRQVAPFQIRAEPKWGTRRYMGLWWIWDEHFVQPETWERVFAPLGIGSMPVTDTRGRVLSTIVQLVVPGLVDVDVTRDDVTCSTCAVCGRNKYLVHMGSAPLAVIGDMPSEMVRTRQSFGAGLTASRPVYVSQQLRRAMAAEGTRGLELLPVVEPQL